jgi:D-alanine-D-alanine ligase
MKIALLHNPKPQAPPPGQPDDAFEEYDSPQTILAISTALSRLGHDVFPIIADRRLPWSLEEGHFDFAFNIAEGEKGRCREAIPAAVCELLGLPYTGSDPLTLAVTLDKQMTRRIVQPDVAVAAGLLFDPSSAGVPTGTGYKNPGEDTGATSLTSLAYPVILKPNAEGSSKGIHDNSLAHTPEQALTQAQYLHEAYHCPILIEEFLPGPEITVALLGNSPTTQVLGSMEIAPATPTPNFIYSLQAKRNYRDRITYHIPPRLESSLLDHIHQLALTAYSLLGCRDFARMDFRLDASHQPRLIECNALPGLNPDDSDLVILSRSILPYDQLIQSIFHHALQRYFPS